MFNEGDRVVFTEEAKKELHWWDLINEEFIICEMVNSSYVSFHPEGSPTGCFQIKTKKLQLATPRKLLSYEEMI
jgi:hypothetical protein